jgi:hypothetical protein
VRQRSGSASFNIETRLFPTAPTLPPQSGMDRSDGLITVDVHMISQPAAGNILGTCVTVYRTKKVGSDPLNSHTVVSFPS